MSPDAAPNPAPIAAGREGDEDLVAAECDTVAVVLQTIAFLVTPSETENSKERVAADASALERAVVLEREMGVSITADGTKGVPKVKFVKFWEQQEPWVTGVPFFRIVIPQHQVLA